MTKWEVSRRTWLRGAGTAMAVPLLEAMGPDVRRARAAGAPRPKRLVFFVFSGGAPDTRLNTTGVGGTNPAAGKPGSLWPYTTGSGFEITPILKPLEDLKQEILVIANLHNGIAENTHDHPGSATAILTQVRPQDIDGPNVRAGISVDQLAASTLKQYTPIPSLFLSNPYHPDANSMIPCWSNAASRMYPITTPSQAFKQIFGDNTVDEKTLKKRAAYRKSVLDHVNEQATRLKARLGTVDKQSLDNYFAGVRSLEERIAKSGSIDRCAAPGTAPKDPPVTSSADPNDPDPYSVAVHSYQFDLPTHFQQMSDLITMAFQCDLTRVAVVHLMVQSLRFPWLPAPYGNFADYHGDIQHGGSTPNRDLALETYVRCVASMVGQFGYLVRKLKMTAEGDGSGSLLDNSTLVCTSELSYGDGHNMRHVPVIVAGRGGGAVSPGRYIAIPGERPIANLYVSLLNAVGIDTTTFGVSDGDVALT